MLHKILKAFLTALAVKAITRLIYRNLIYKQKKQNIMIRAIITLLIIALVAGLLGFGGIAGASAYIAKIIFYVFLILLIISVVASLLRRA
jgi:uncharacterized membrane protein YtjA (UPF0391 family)